MQHTEVIKLFYDFIEQRPDLDPKDYLSLRDYKNEQGRISRHLNKARKALTKFSSLPYDEAKLIDCLQSTFSGRLSLNVTTQELEYTVGQYFPTEYRLAVAEVLEKYNS